MFKKTLAALVAALGLDDEKKAAALVEVNKLPDDGEPPGGNDSDTTDDFKHNAKAIAALRKENSELKSLLQEQQSVLTALDKRFKDQDAVIADQNKTAAAKKVEDLIAKAKTDGRIPSAAGNDVEKRWRGLLEANFDAAAELLNAQTAKTTQAQTGAGGATGSAGTTGGAENLYTDTTAKALAAGLPAAFQRVLTAPSPN